MEATRGAALSSAPTGNPIVPDSILWNEPLARRSQHGGQPGTSALQRLGDWAKRPGTLAQRPTRAASRGARGGGEEGGAGAFLSARGGSLSAAPPTELSHGSIKKSAFGTTLSRSR